TGRGMPRKRPGVPRHGTLRCGVPHQRRLGALPPSSGARNEMKPAPQRSQATCRNGGALLFDTGKSSTLARLARRPLAGPAKADTIDLQQLCWFAAHTGLYRDVEGTRMEARANAEDRQLERAPLIVRRVDAIPVALPLKRPMKMAGVTIAHAYNLIVRIE